MPGFGAFGAIPFKAPRPEGSGVTHGAALFGAPSAPSAPTAPWTPPPIPPGYYNPIRDIEGSEGKRGSEQSLSGLSRERTNAEGTYATNLGVLGQREAQASQTAQETLDRLAESYKKLGVRQSEQGNATGTLYGGALISAAAKRAANEGVAKHADEVARASQLQGFENERGRLSTAESQLVGPGGSLTEAMQNAHVNEQAFEESLGLLKGNEAAANGYVAPTAPRPAARRAQPTSGRGVIAAARRKAWR